MERKKGNFVPAYKKGINKSLKTTYRSVSNKKILETNTKMFKFFMEDTLQLFS